MKSVPECSLCGYQGILVHFLLIVVEEVPEDTRDIQLVGECPKCSHKTTLSICQMVKNAQEALDGG